MRKHSLACLGEGSTRKETVHCVVLLIGCNLFHPIKCTTHIWVVTRHQYGISALVSKTSLREEISGGVAKCRLFSQAALDRPYSRIWMHRIIRNIRWLTCYAPESRMIGIKGNNDVIFLASRLVTTKQQQQPKRWTSPVTIEYTTFERGK